MNKIVYCLFALCFFVFGCFDARQDCAKNPLACKCDLSCSDTDECVMHSVLIENRDTLVPVCVLKQDVSCTDDSSCGVDNVCYQGFCEELDCIDECDASQVCTKYPDNQELVCN